ncbi:hypothetical protein GQ43DRAFT_346858, partial [Delitschia confertaspora ATCC 74209]
MRIRKSFAGAFIGLCLIAALAGFSPSEYQLPQYKQSDKLLHFITFFLVTVTFYWILETSRRKVVQLTISVCTIGLGLSSEIIQSLLPNGRQFDPYDIVANILGSGLAVALCNWYHKRMLERKRAARGYAAVAGDDVGEADVELGEGIGQQESGVVGRSVEEELDNWDENAEDWDDTEAHKESTNVHPEAADNAGDMGVADNKRN